MCTMLAELMASEKNIPAIPALITGCFGGDIALSECSKPKLNELRKYILGKVCRNSARVYMANIKAVLNIYADELPGRDLSLLNVRAEATVSVFLDADELKRLEKYARTLRGKERMYALYFLCRYRILHKSLLFALRLARPLFHFFDYNTIPCSCQADAQKKSRPVRTALHFA